MRLGRSELARPTPRARSSACWRRRRQQRQSRRDGRVFAGFGAEAYHHAHLYAERARRVRIRRLLAHTSPLSSPPFIMMSRAELDRVFHDTAMKKRCVQFSFFSRRNGCNVPYRTHRLAILAMSLLSLFDITQPTDCARGPQHAHGVRAGQGGQRAAQNGSATSFPSLVDLMPNSPSESLQAATKVTYGCDQLSPTEAI
jgi:hypothetical protein